MRLPQRRTAGYPPPALHQNLVCCALWWSDSRAALQDRSRSNVKEEGKLEAAEQMSRKTGSSAGHHLPGDQPNAGTTATAAERHLKHINPHVDTRARRQLYNTPACMYKHVLTHKAAQHAMEENERKWILKRERVERQGERQRK